MLVNHVIVLYCNLMGYPSNLVVTGGGGGGGILKNMKVSIRSGINCIY